MKLNNNKPTSLTLTLNPNHNPKTRSTLNGFCTAQKLMKYITTKIHVILDSSIRKLYW